MLSRQFFVCLVIAVFCSCKNENEKTKTSQSNQQVSATSSDSNNIDRDFSAFIERFSSDSAFQLSRTKFPLRVKQYDIENIDTIIYKQQSEFEMMDLRKMESDDRYDRWKQEIAVEKSQRKATIEIRGIDNGIMVDYYYEKRNGKWFFVGVEDSST